MKKSKEYMEGLEAAKCTSSDAPHNPYMLARPHPEDRLLAAEWYKGWEDGRKKIKPVRKKK